MLRALSVNQPLTITENGASTQEILNQVLKNDALNDSYVRKMQISFWDWQY